MDQSHIFDFAAQLARIQIAISERPGRRQTVDRSVPGVWMAMDAATVTPYPSSNPNRAQALPGGREWEEISAEQCVRKFARAGVDCFFFWLSEYSNSNQIEKDLLAAGLKRFSNTSYPILARAAGAVAMPATSLEIRPYDPQRDWAAMDEYPNELARRRVLQSPKWGDEQHFIAWKGKTPVATGGLTIGGSMGYVNAGGTLEAYRNRGAQTALIAARINYACERGCTMLASETLGMLKTSLGNLQRAGFEIIFEKQVFGGSARR